MKRFNDTYHNEAIIGKLGFVNRKWADRLLFGFTYSNMYQDIQTGVRQNTVYGEKHRKGHSLMPSLEYNKRNLFTDGLDLVFTANYNKNLTTNVDTSAYEYNWAGDKHLMNSRGEQSYQHTRSDNNNWNGTVTLNYRIGKAHMFTFNNVLNCLPPLQHLPADERGTDRRHRQGDTQKHCRPLLSPDAVRTLEPLRFRKALQPVCSRPDGNR